MGSSEELNELGWYVSTEGYNFITENGIVKDKKTILLNVLNADIKDFGEAILSNELKKDKTGKVVLQIQKVRNVAAPKAKEESQAAPRMLKLILTDGHITCQAIEISNLSSISRTHTPPGSKLLINGARICSNCILLQPSCCTLLGGRVPVLCEKWELVKNISDQVRTSAGTDGPPPWVNFGEKIISSVSGEPFKALVEKTSKETTNEFDVHRQDAIATATTGAVKKVFGGGTKPMAAVDNKQNYRKYNNTRENLNQEPRGRGRRDNKEKMVDKMQKPPEKISLFAFLEDKLLVNEATDVKTNSKTLDDNNFSRQDVPPKAAMQFRDFPRNPPAYNPPRNLQPKYSNSMAKPRVTNYIPKNVNKPTGAYNSENIMQNNAPAAITNNPTPSAIESVSRNFGKMSIDTQFASRSLRQHLNLSNNKNEVAKLNETPNSGAWNWKIGDLCMAKYWEDGKFYNATVTNLTERTCVVQFNGYGNVEEVLKIDCIPITEMAQEPPRSNHNYKGSFGYRNNRRTYSNNHSHNKAV